MAIYSNLQVSCVHLPKCASCHKTHASGIPRAHGEPCQVLRYRPGEEYKRHPDFFDPADTEELRNGGQRMATFIIYLSTLPRSSGGSTVFPRTGQRGAGRGSRRAGSQKGERPVAHSHSFFEIFLEPPSKLSVHMRVSSNSPTIIMYFCTGCRARLKAKRIPPTTTCAMHRPAHVESQLPLMNRCFIKKQASAYFAGGRPCGALVQHPHGWVH